MADYVIKAEAFADTPDEELAELYQDGNDDAFEEIIRRYRPFVRSKIGSYYLTGGDDEDINQECIIGIFKAARDYRRNNDASFRTFVNICVTRQLVTAIKKANRKKHIPLNSYISLNKKVYNIKDDRVLIDILSSEHISDPEEIVIEKENFNGFEVKINKALSKLELRVLAFYLEGKTYQEISELIDKDIKSVDNAIQRIKKKIETLIDEDTD